MRVVILGSSEMLYSMIEGILKTNAQIVGIVNWQSIKKKSFWKALKSDYIQKSIEKLKLPILRIKSANSKEFKSELLKLNPDLLIVGTWGEKIKKEIYDIPKIAAVNIHPSLLPKYRGANPYSRAIMFGETKSGATIHLLNEKFDAGAILLQKEVDILNTDNAQTLKTRICKIIPSMCVELIQKLDSEILVPKEQNKETASYYPHVKPNEIVIETDKMTFQEIHNRIRGLAPWQSTYLLYKDEYFKIFEYNQTSKYIKRNRNNLCLETKDNKFIYFKNLQAFGGIKKYFTSIILNLLHL